MLEIHGSYGVDYAHLNMGKLEWERIKTNHIYLHVYSVKKVTQKTKNAAFFEIKILKFF